MTESPGRTLLPGSAGVTETTKHALIAVDHHQRHARRRYHKDMLGINDQRYQRQNRRQSAEPALDRSK
ncbi:hypothetical protein KCP76_15635 [Salmonella enterica subsp. enterica serovar Weltevreden]|nr:hypothetical protein KCP76_15635 [Salmonella enterica subsp. enterica serovar Weltevreden]